jgi:hypothetical protein
MKSFTRRRALSFFFALALVLSLCPGAHAEEPESPAPTIVLNNSSFVMERGESQTCGATVTPDGSTVVWSSSNTSVATVNGGAITAMSAGEATITASIKDHPAVTASCSVTVSGIVLSATSMDMMENERQSLPSCRLYGGAAGKPVSWTSGSPTVVRINGSQADGLSAGTAVLSATAGAYQATVSAVVRLNQAQSISASAGIGRPLSFSSLYGELNSQCVSMTGSSLSLLTGLGVSTSEGTLFLNYRSPEDTGSGVAQSGNYLSPSAPRGPYLSDISFVPNAYYGGDRATIRYSGVGQNGRTFQGNIIVTLDTVSNNIVLSASASSPALLSGQRLGQICQQMTGTPLSYLTFTLPSENRGVLYYDYVSAYDYGSKVTTTARYSQSDLDRISFLPTPGYAGTVVIYYTGYGLSGAKYTGQITVSVSQSTDGGPVYNIGTKGVVTFGESDFYNYCRSLTGQTLNYVQFSLPSPSEGTLYYDYSSSGSYNSLVTTGASYYYTRNPRISRISFVPNSSFTGAVQISFTGWDTAGNRFTGLVKINVRSEGSGKVHYTCVAGQSVKLAASDFNNLSQSLTGSGLRYITFHVLPDWRDGSLYYNRTNSNSGTLISRNNRYSYSYLSDVSFWSGTGFSGNTEVSFTGEANNGDTFTGTLVIEAVNRGQQTLTYSTDYRKARAFYVDDFNELCRWVTNSQLNYVRFELPAANQGTLYYNYRSDGSYDSAVTASTNYYRSSYRQLSQVSFLPAAGFSGTASIPFTGWANDGTQFTGTIEIAVGIPQPEATVSYTTRSAPVAFRTTDFEQAYSRYKLTSLRFESLPPPNAGRLYYQYTSPTQYSWQASVNTDYWVSGTPPLSSLTFVPKAGYTGTVSIPYTATNTNGTKYVGQVSIKVEPTQSSAYFNDMAGYAAQALAAVDYLHESEIVKGIGGSQYGPSLSIQRGDFSLMLYRAFRLFSPAAGGAFADVPSDAYFSQSIYTLRALGIINGTGNNLFQPYSTITRQDAMLMVQRTLQIAGWSANDANTGYLSPYADRNEVSPYAQGGMAYAIQAGLLPTDGVRLAPLAPLTRVDMAQVLHRALTY